MKWQTINYQAADAGQTFAASLRETGFGVINNHPIDFDEIERLYEAWTDFFVSELRQKMDYEICAKTQNGYVSQSLSEVAKGYSVKDIKEFFNYYPWGRCPTILKDQTQALYDSLTAVGCTILDWLEQALPDDIAAQLSEPLHQMVTDSERTFCRINYYPALSGQENPGAVRAQRHTDICLLTVLTSASAKGLQAQDTSGHWYDIPCDPGTLIINAGDMLAECTQGYYPSTWHRVLKPTGEAAMKPRMSCPLFLHPRSEVVLSARHTADSYLNERLEEIGLRKAS